MRQLPFLLLLWLPAFFRQPALAQTNPSASASHLAIIPQPVHLKPLPGNFMLTAKTKIYITPHDAELKLLAGMLAAQVESTTGYVLPVVEKANVLKAKNAIMLHKAPTADSLGKEGYWLDVRPENITVRALHGQGLFYGLQTFYQLLPPAPIAPNTKTKVAIPAVTIQDEPRYNWRGLMLDVGRYFYPVSFIKKYLDYMALHKLNTFHWHLTEDHGWRIEIKKHPRLTQISANRAGTQVGNREQIDYRPHGGYYTQAEIKDVVAYASARYINVVPEIEMPGHTLAVLAAYPELSCTGGPFTMPLQWGIQKDIYCAGNEQTFRFLEDVLTEVAALFPSPIIHIGGDEAPKDRWKACAKCQARIQTEGLQDEHELQSYFIKRIEKFLLTKNKNIIGWDEILEGGLAPNAAVMSWRGIQGGIAAAKAHHQVVMSPSSHLYLDYYQGDRALEPKAIGGMLLLEKVYGYEPTPAELSPEEATYIMGTQGNVWAEYIHTPEKVEYMTFPRAAALAEVAWTPAHLKNWESFKQRMETQYQRYDALGINYARSAHNVFLETTPDPANRLVMVALKTGSHNTRIFYTLDGTEPTPESLQYSGPFKITSPAVVKAATFRHRTQLGKVTTRAIQEQDLSGKKE